MDYQSVITSVSPERIGIITLNRPDKRNALSIQMREEISVCLNQWKDSDEVEIVIITGSGNSFSAGFDLQEFSQLEKLREIYTSSSKYHRDLWFFPKPTIAAINGPALGGALDLATLCDIRICSKSARFGHPEIKFGANPLYTPLQWIVGMGMARYLCLSGIIIDAEDAQRMGLVSAVTEADALTSAITLAATIREAPAPTLICTKQYMTHTGSSFEEAFSAEHDRPFEQLIQKLAR